jgi:hypothetical protein
MKSNPDKISSGHMNIHLIETESDSNTSVIDFSGKIDFDTTECDIFFTKDQDRDNKIILNDIINVKINPKWITLSYQKYFSLYEVEILWLDFSSTWEPVVVLDSIPSLIKLKSFAMEKENELAFDALYEVLEFIMKNKDLIINIDNQNFSTYSTLSKQVNHFINNSKKYSKTEKTRLISNLRVINLTNPPNYLNKILRDYYKIKYFTHSQMNELTIEEQLNRLGNYLEIVKKKLICLKSGIGILGKVVEETTRNCFIIFHSYESEVNYVAFLFKGPKKMKDIIGQAFKYHLVSYTILDVAEDV